MPCAWVARFAARAWQAQSSNAQLSLGEVGI